MGFKKFERVHDVQIDAVETCSEDAAQVTQRVCFLFTFAA